ncbi:MAG TPA: hypothetical protein VFL59_07140 [Candidatus Nanopelagicales bacterium]|nr:hypothetical protein [Candidatus Nanopelagicales bacterium]
MTTTLHELPPLHVTTVGIPPDEHITVRESHRQERALWWSTDRIAWLGLWVLVLMLVLVAAAYAAPRTATSTSSAAWADYRAGEQVTTSTGTLGSPQLVSLFTGEAYPALPLH